MSQRDTKPCTGCLRALQNEEGPQNGFSVYRCATIVGNTTARMLFLLALLCGAIASSEAVSVCEPVLGADKCETWAAIYNGPGQYDVTGYVDSSRSIAASPDGKTVFVAGGSDGDPTNGYDYDLIVVAFDAATGTQRWVSRYKQATADLSSATPFSFAVSPTGSSVVITGLLESVDRKRSGIATVAFAAETGTELWSALCYEPPLNATRPDVTISADGSRVNTAGYTYRRHPDTGARSDYGGLTVAYDASNGQQLWTDSFAGGFGKINARISAAPDGSRLYAAASELDADGFSAAWVLIAYDPATGERLNTAHHPTVGSLPAGIAVSPDSSRVFIAGAKSNNSALTVAYDAAGNELWDAQFGSSSTSSTRPWYYGAIAVSPDGSRVFITSLGSKGDTVRVFGFDTVAYDAVTGEQKWTARYDNNVIDCLCGPTIAANPSGGEVYITGMAHAIPFTNRDSNTIAYDSATGAQKWVAIHKSERGNNESNSIAAGPKGDRIFVAGSVDSQLENVPATPNLLALAYETGLLPTLRPISAHSRKTHNAAGPFYVTLPLEGNTGNESRRADANGGHEIVFKFARPVTFQDASVTPAAGKTAELDGPPATSGDAKEVNVKLKNVSNVQTITVKLSSVSDGTDTNDVSVQMGVLVGDSNSDGSVNSGDAQQARNRSGQLTDATNFRSDVNTDGTINSGDAFIVRGRSGESIKP